MFLFLFEFLFVLVKPFQINARADFNPVISFVGDNYTGLPYCAFYMDAFASFSIVNGAFISNTGDEINPGAIRTSGNEPVLISNTYFENNKGTFEGGAIYIEVRHFEINQCTFIQNKCYTESTLNSNGGAIFVRSQSNFIQTIDSCIFIENSAKTYGGSIFIDFPSYSYNLSIITNCNFSYSQSESSGGAIASNHSDVINEGTSSEFRIENCEFESCVSQTGGAIFLTDFETKLDQKIVCNCRFKNETATHHGGAIVSYAPSVEIYECSFVECVAGNNDVGVGGALFLGQPPSGEIDLVCKCTFTRCNSSQAAGCLFAYCIRSSADRNAAVIVRSCNFADCNSTEEGGAIASGHVSSFGGNNKIEVEDCFFTNCEAGKGGAFHSMSGTAETNEETQISNCTFVNCFASDSSHEGYSIYCRSYKICIENCKFNDHKRATDSKSCCIVYVETNEKIPPAINFLHFESNTGVASLILYTLQNITMEGLTFNKITDNIPCINLDNWRVGGDLYIKNSFFSNILMSTCITTTTKVKTFTTYLEGCQFINISTRKNIRGTYISGCGSSILCLNRGNLVVSECNFTNNVAEVNGGAIYAESDAIEIHNCQFVLCSTGPNEENGLGGAVFLNQTLSGGYDIFFQNYFFNCSAGYGGGGLFIYCRDVYMASEILGSDFGKYGIKIYSCNFTDCTSGFEGGAISSGILNEETNQIEGDNDLQIRLCVFTRCESAKGGALYFQDGTPEGDEDTLITSCNFTNCYASGPEHEGYSIYCRSYRITIQNCAFREHKRGTNIQTACIVYVETNEAEVSPEIRDLTFEDNSGVSGLVVKTIKITTIEGLTFNNITDNLPCINLDNWDTKEGVNIRNSDFTNIEDARGIFTSTGMKKFPVTVDSCRFINNSIKKYTQTDLIHSGCGSSILCQNRKDEDEQVYIEKCNFTNNDAESYGGAIYAETNTIELNGCRFELCTSGVDDDEGRGGGVYITEESGESFEQINENTFINCHASHSGGGLFIFCHDVKTRTIEESNKMTGKEYYFQILDNDFTYCQSKSGGGALCISSFYPSFIEGCKFESNIVHNGTGGALYINPDTENKLESCSIFNCSFLSNKAKDGFAICIDGNDNDTTINISLNKFIDNYNIETINDSFIISLEVCCVSRQKIIAENTFSNQENGENIKVNEFSCFDSQYSLTLQFSESDYFSKSLKFTDSNDFSETNIFSQSAKFSQSKIFSESNIFSQSTRFSQSKMFSESNIFSQSAKFSQSKIFSESNIFSQSAKFSQSKIFSEPNIFSQSAKFSQSKIFSESNIFSQSTRFSQSKIFSESNIFSQSAKFSQSKIFSESNIFSQSAIFSQSKIFSESNIFSQSAKFSQSKIFSEPNIFSQSAKFSQSKIFSESNIFSQSVKFSQSKIFSESNIFSQSEGLEKSDDLSQPSLGTSSDLSMSTASQFFSLSMKFSQTNFFTKSREFTISTLKEIFDEESFFSGSNCFTHSISSSFNDFESPIQLSTSKSFSPSDSFTYSKEFTYSIKFSESKSFSSFFVPFNTPRNSKSLSLFLSFVSLRSVSFSLTISPSFLYTNFLMPNGEYTICYTQIYIDRYLPYIFQFLSPTYIPVEILVELKDVKKKITQEQLIGIVCGSAACFFGIIGIIFLVVQKMKAIKAYDDYSISSEITKAAEPRNQAENDDNDDEVDLDFWL
ncbi:hypothetical protein M9Y10_033224 [Tritrichomonas musculus]|uniref:Right handed beta helix domain-containing protein n=1 Tax=Tritrichomonas musculus TaxID=1915356 RepID=A0ABR2GZ09_9EUKA